MAVLKQNAWIRYLKQRQIKNAVVLIPKPEHSLALDSIFRRKHFGQTVVVRSCIITACCQLKTMLYDGWGKQEAKRQLQVIETLRQHCVTHVCH